MAEKVTKNSKSTSLLSFHYVKSRSARVNPVLPGVVLDEGHLNAEMEM